MWRVCSGKPLEFRKWCVLIRRNIIYFLPVLVQNFSTQIEMGAEIGEAFTFWNVYYWKSGMTGLALEIVL